MDTIKGAIGDAIVTSLWVFSLPFLGIFAAITSKFIGLEPQSISGLLIATLIASLFVLVFSILGKVLGDASFNPTVTVSFYAAGLKPDTSLFSMAVRFPAQAIGAVVGAISITAFMPEQYKQSLKGPSLKVDLHTGAIAEGLLTFVFCLIVLMVVLKGPRNFFLKVWFMAVATVGLFIFGSAYTGPSMNPAIAFGWAYMGNWHNSWGFFYVYWVSPFVGATLAAWFFRFFVPITQAANKEKKA